MKAYYSSSIENYFKKSLNFNRSDSILGELSKNGLKIETFQKHAWLKQIEMLDEVLFGQKGHVLFEVKIPRIGKRIDNIAIINSKVYLIEFKTTFKEEFENENIKNDLDQLLDYAVDLKNFHEGSYNLEIIPILVTNKKVKSDTFNESNKFEDGVYHPVVFNENDFKEKFLAITKKFTKSESFDFFKWLNSNYKPSPNIIEAAKFIYENHDVKEITTHDAESQNLESTTNKIIDIIEHSQKQNQKSIIFLTGVPGSGKTLVGLNIPFILAKKKIHLYSAYLTGNGPLEKVLSEAIFPKGKKKKSNSKDALKTRIRNIHSFRDDALDDFNMVPAEQVVVFDEAQRAWDNEKTKSFLIQNSKKQINMSEPEFLISTMDRHKDWCSIVCLVGNGQEINTGESGINEWFIALNNRFKHWNIFLSENAIRNNKYIDLEMIRNIKYKNVNELNLSTSLRSLRSEKLALLIDSILDLKTDVSKELLNEVSINFKIFITRDLNFAKDKIRQIARGSERYGMVASSQAYRLRSEGVNVKINVEPIHWYLKGKSDVRSSFYLEEAATEFYTQGLELDYTLVNWEADLRLLNDKWQFFKFKGTKWVNVKKNIDKRYRLNAYRVLLTRARKGMIIYIPRGNEKDNTRNPDFYNGIYNYLKSLGIEEISRYLG
jgi:DUF2075 family protein